jgi:tetratricopeptide (TPR) repeat protein
MGRRLPPYVRGPGPLRRIAVAVVAVVLAISALGFLVWSVTTHSSSRLAWLTSIATVLAVVLSSWGMSIAMLAWVIRTRKEVAGSGLGSDRGQVVVGEIPREPTGFQPRAGLQAKVTVDGGVTVLSAVTGGRGVGKTQLAAAVARRRITEQWPVVAWIVAEDPDQALTGMDRLARALGLAATEDDSQTAARAARAWLETRASARCLLVFDNVPDPTVVQQWLPATGHAQIIITSTSRACEDLGTPLRVEPFTPTEAVAFLRARTGLADLAGAYEIAREVGHLPLALGQAAAAIHSQHLTYDSMLERIRTLPVDRYLRRQASDVYPRGAAQAMLLAVQQIEETEPFARILTALIAVLSPAGVRRDVLEALTSQNEEPGLGLNDHAGISVPDIDSALGRLAEASLVTFTLSDDAVLMHRFTQRVLRDRADRAGLLPGLIVQAARLIRDQWPNPRTAVPEGEQWVTRRSLGQHLITQTDALWGVTAVRIDSDITAHTQALDEARAIVLLLRRRSVSYLWDINDPGRAIEIGISVVADHERIFGDDSEATTGARMGLALAYGMQGQHDEAIVLNERVVAWYSINRGEFDPTTLNMRNTLANNYLESAEDFAQPTRLTTAVALHEQNYAQWRQVGPGSDEYAASFFTDANLARAYTKIGKTDEAIKIAERAVQRCEQKFGSLHYLTAAALYAYAEAYAAAGRIDEALTASYRLVRDANSTWGADSPLTLRYLQQQAEFLGQTGNAKIAISSLEEIAISFEQLLGENNPNTRNALEALFKLYCQAGNVTSAARTHERIIQICLNTVGDDSLLTQRIRNEIIDLPTRKGARQKLLTIWRQRRSA